MDDLIIILKAGPCFFQGLRTYFFLKRYLVTW